MTLHQILWNNMMMSLGLKQLQSILLALIITSTLQVKVSAQAGTPTLQ